MTTQVEVIKNLPYQGHVSNGGWILKRKWWELEDENLSFPLRPQTIAKDKNQRSYIKNNIGHWSNDTLYLALQNGEAFAEIIFEDHNSTTPSSSTTTTTTSDSYQILVTVTLDLVTITDKGRWKPLEIQQDPLVLTGCAILPLHNLRGVG